MANAALIAKAAATVLTDENTRKTMGWLAVAVLSPIILLIAFLCALASGTATHNISAAELCFYGGELPADTPEEYRTYVEDMRTSFDLLDGFISTLNGKTEEGKSLDGTRVKAFFYALYFGEDSPSRRDHQRFVDCFVTYRRKVVREITYWCCPTHDRDMIECPISQIVEGKIFIAFLRLYYKLQHQGRPVLEQLLADLQTVRNRRLLWSLDIVGLNNQIADLTRQERLLTVLKKQGAVDPDIFISRTDQLAERLRSAKQAKSRLLDAEEDQTITQTQKLLNVLDDAPEFLEAFDGELFGELVDKIIVDSNERLRFRLINGLELTENIERTVR